jgi:transmembrane sensor
LSIKSQNSCDIGRRGGKPLPDKQLIMHQDFDSIYFLGNEFAANESFQAYVFRTNAEDIQFWNNWISQHPERQAEVEEAVKLLLLLIPQKTVTTEKHKEAALENLFSAIRQETAPPQAPAASIPFYPQPAAEAGIRSMMPRIKRWRVLAAAVVTGILCLTGAGYLLQRHLAAADLVYQTAYGETKTVTLPDSSRVTLNGNSRLSHAAGWDGTRPREVWIAGEAFFEVTHKGKNKNARFIVHTPKLNVEVLGTRFNVFNRQDKTDVVLNSGKVKLAIAASAKDTLTLYMRPGDQVAFSRKTAAIVKSQVNAEALTSWRNKVLVFEGTPLYRIAEIIEDTYGVEVVFTANRQANQKLAGTIPNGNLDLLLAALAKSSNLNISRRNNTIVIENNPPMSGNE